MKQTIKDDIAELNDKITLVKASPDKLIKDYENWIVEYSNSISDKGYQKKGIEIFDSISMLIGADGFKKISEMLSSDKTLKSDEDKGALKNFIESNIKIYKNEILTSEDPSDRIIIMMKRVIKLAGHKDVSDLMLQKQREQTEYSRNQRKKTMG